MTMVYELHVAFNNKGNFKYNHLKQKIPEGIDLEVRVSKNRGKSAKLYWPGDFEVEYRYKGRKISDIGYDNPYLIMSHRAKEVLFDLLEPNGEFLPVHCVQNPDLIVFHPLVCPTDALDYEKTEFSYTLFRGEKPVPTRVTWHYFIQEKVSTLPIFFLRESTAIYVTDSFVERVRENKLKGFGFRRLWSSELGCIHSDRMWGPYPEGEDINW